MKKYLLPEAGKFYRANLHCHSTCSDGNKTKEELKEAYKNAGYSVLAFTDHNALLDHTDMSDKDFITITAYEFDITNKKSPFDFCEAYHFNLYSKEPHNVKQVCYNPKYLSGNPRKYLDIQEYIGSTDYERTYDVNKINDLIKKANDNGFLVCYNHPAWSLNTLDDYRNLEGIFAMEIYNGISDKYYGIPDENTQIYDNMLRMDKRIFCLASDDDHNKFPFGHPRCDSFGGWTMIKAEKLEYHSIINALEKGNFYATTGPEIYELYIEDNLIHVKTSPAVYITMTTKGRRTQRECGNFEGDLVSEAVFETIESDGFLRITVTDEKGKHAYTNGYFNLYDSNVKK